MMGGRDAQVSSSKAPDLSVFGARMDGFFAWVHAMERAILVAAKLEGRRVSLLGGDGLPAEEAIRFVGEYGTAFPATPAEQVHKTPAFSRYQDKARGGGPRKVLVNFMGVAGASGLLPLHYTRLICERLKQKDAALADFIDIFNHRLLALFYRAWVKYRLPYQYEQAILQSKVDPVTQFVQALVGDRTEKPLVSQLYFAGHYQRRCRSAANLETMLATLLSTSVRIEQFQGHWIFIDEQQRSRLGAPNGSQQRLGDGILVGKRYWDVGAGITICIGPLMMQHYRTWLPGSSNYNFLVRLIDRYVPLHIRVNLQFSVIYEPGHEQKLGEGVSLKRTAWLRRAQMDEKINAANQQGVRICEGVNKAIIEVGESCEEPAVQSQWIRVANYQIERGKDLSEK